MGLKKLQRFAEIRTFKNVLEYPLHMQGKWSSYFGNNNPVTLELACGKGEYAIGLGRMCSNRNFIGVDLKGNRIWVGARKALAEGLNNVAFIRSQIDKTDQYFTPGEVSEIWITFPDPQLRTSRAKKRLTHPHFLRIYQKFLTKDGFIHLKTDSPDLYGFTKMVITHYGLNMLEDNADVYANGDAGDVLNIKTYYESLDIAKSKKIHYLRFSLPDLIPEDRDAEFKEIIVEEEISRRRS